MKKTYSLLLASVLTVTIFAQAPEKMSYQAVIRDAGNNLVTSQGVGMQLSILQGTITGPAVYIETQTPTTNINGLVSIEIGSGTVVSGVFNTIDWSAGPYYIKTETDPTGGITYTITGTSQLMSVPYALHAKTAESVTGTVNYTESDPIFGASIANAITAVDTSNWNNHTVDTQLDSNDIANLGYVAGPHSTLTETDPVFGASIANGITAVDTANWNNHTVDTQLDSNDIANLGYVAGGIIAEVDGSITNELQTLSRTNDSITLSSGGGTVSIDNLAWATADYDSGFQIMSSQNGAASYRELTHGIGNYPSRVLVLVRAIDGNNSGFIFHGIGSSQQDDDTGNAHHGGVVYAYDQTRVRLWVPDANNSDNSGAIINVNDGWGEETNVQTSHTAQIRVLCWE